MIDKAKLGTRYVCFQCGTRFYDLNRPAPLCPECSADQREAPARDIRALLSKSGRTGSYEDGAETAAVVEEDDEYGGLGEVDDDDDDDDDDVDADGDEEDDEEPAEEED